MYIDFDCLLRINKGQKIVLNFSIDKSSHKIPYVSLTTVDVALERLYLETASYKASRPSLTSL